AGNGMYLSTNSGASWTSIGTGITSTSIRSITFIGTDIFVGTQNGIFHSTNNGGSWTQANGGLTSLNVQSLTSFGTNLVAGAGFGLYVSTNSGGSWTTINTGLPSSFGIILPIIYTLGAVPFAGGTTIYAGTAGLGLWRRPASQFTSVDLLSPAVPEMFFLEQNYPNPFNPTTRIGFSIPHTSHVTLTVFDVLGNEVATLVNRNMNAGSYEVIFNAAGLASGVYFYRLQAEGLAQSRKLILQR
ncbi:MAG TPA: T9SS type A sorting domain-containing protein, partial [Bacteroidota bacterium]|nr:T9SS type A sorting domain-containing protein [Bacteroidota bacterium]